MGLISEIVSFWPLGQTISMLTVLPLTFGLGKAEGGKTVSMEIVWPSGQKDTISDIRPNQFITVKEGKGITSAQPMVVAKAGGKE